jgi:acyl-CoA synthetase (NDP forming)
VKGNESNMKYLFEPRGVAVIGASHTPGKIGYKVVENIVVGGYKGKIYPINPRGGELLGWPVHKAMEDIQGPVDVAVITVPAEIVYSAIEECAQKEQSSSLPASPRSAT